MMDLGWITKWETTSTASSKFINILLIVDYFFLNTDFSFRWNSYEANLLTTFEGLLDSEALSDVTLFCEGNVTWLSQNLVVL